MQACPGSCRLIRHPRRDRPKPFPICRCRVRPHDTANVPITIERIVVVGAPLAARAGFVGLFEYEHRSPMVAFGGKADKRQYLAIAGLSAYDPAATELLCVVWSGTYTALPITPII